LGLGGKTILKIPEHGGHVTIVFNDINGMSIGVKNRFMLLRSEKPEKLL